MSFEEEIKKTGGMKVFESKQGKIAWCLPDMREGLIKAGYIPFIPSELEAIAKNKEITSSTIELINSVKKLFGGMVI